MPGHFRPADHSRGDANTIGGYMAVHERPAAFEGADGFSYSVSIETDTTGDSAKPYGAFLLFVRWSRIGAQAPEGHLETDFLATCATPDEARRAVGALALKEVKRLLDELVDAKRGSSRRAWWNGA